MKKLEYEIFITNSNKYLITMKKFVYNFIDKLIVIFMFLHKVNIFANYQLKKLVYFKFFK